MTDEEHDVAKMKRQTVSTPDGPRSVKVAEAHRFDPDEFYRVHRGGSGNVIVVFADKRGGSRVGLFGSIETAQKWALSFGNEWRCTFVPYVVDEPDFGNAVKN